MSFQCFLSSEFGISQEQPKSSPFVPSLLRTAQIFPASLGKLEHGSLVKTLNCLNLTKELKLEALQRVPGSCVRTLPQYHLSPRKLMPPEKTEDLLRPTPGGHPQCTFSQVPASCKYAWGWADGRESHPTPPTLLQLTPSTEGWPSNRLSKGPVEEHHRCPGFSAN